MNERMKDCVLLKGVALEKEPSNPAKSRAAVAVFIVGGEAEGEATRVTPLWIISRPIGQRHRMSASQGGGTAPSSGELLNITLRMAVENLIDRIMAILQK